MISTMRRTRINLEQLIDVVQKSFLDLKRETLDYIFFTWCACMEQIMLCEGDNTYRIPHLHKNRLRMGEGLPSKFECSEEAATIAGLIMLQ